ncbi:MAG: glycosyltransferase family 25 protein [Rheinheimera sp.]
MSALDPTQIPVFVINLETSPERYQYAEQQLLALGIQPQRFNAVYGKNLSVQDIDACYDKMTNQQQFRRSLSLGEIGCYLSHRGIWQYMQEHNIEVAIVLEDDIDIDAKLPDSIKQISGLTGWDHIKLSDDRNTPAHQTMPLENGFKLVNFKKVPNCATGYAISLQGVNKLLRREKFFRPVDIDLQFGHELDLQLFSLLPYTIWPSSKFDSVINAISGGSRKGDTTFLRNLKYRLAAAWHRVCYTSGDLNQIK